MACQACCDFLRVLYEKLREKECMKRGQIYEGVVERVDFPNKAVVAVESTGVDGMTVKEYAMVKGAITGQRIRFVVTKSRKEHAQGRLKEVLAHGQIECRNPACTHFGTCGGCHYQRIPYEQQLELKKEQVLRLVDAVYQSRDGETYQYDGILASHTEWEYRNKMEFSFGDEVKDGPLTLGMHKKGSFHDIIDAEGCRIVHSDFSKILACVRDYAREQEWTHYHKNSHQGFLRHLLLRRAVKTGELLVALVTSSQQEASLDELSAKLQALSLEGIITGFLHVINDSLGDVVQSDETRLIYGREWFTEEILGLRFRISPFSFFQTNTLGAELLYQQVRKYILGETDLSDKVVFDLYSGTGTIAQVLAPVSKRVIGVEIVEEAVEAARQNAAENGLSNCEFIAGDVLKVIDEITEKPDYIVLDPPRDGVHPKALRKIIDYGVAEIVYISCKPTSFARDLAVFQEKGYELKRICNVDLFPETVHVETCVLLTHKKPTSFIEVTMDYEKIVPNQKPGKATYKMITDYVKEKYDLVVKSTTIADVKRSFGLEVGDYNVKEEKTNYRKEKITPEKRQAVEDALRHFGVIE